MQTIKRIIPDLNNLQLINVLLDNKKDVVGPEKLKEIYLEKIENFEEECEDKLIKVLAELDISSMVKPDRYSLIYNMEYVTVVSAYHYTPNDFGKIMREIVKEVLNKNLYKIRFYMFINILEGRMLGRIEYRFRYYHKDA